MAKIFPMEGSSSSFQAHLTQLDQKRKAAVTLAFQGEFCSSISIFRKVVKEVPRMPSEWRPHTDILQEIRYAMEDSFQQYVQRTMATLQKTLQSLWEKGCNEVSQAQFDDVMRQHAADVEYIGNTAAKLTHMALFTDYMCEHGISDLRLMQLEVMFTEVASIVKKQTS